MTTSTYLRLLALALTGAAALVTGGCGDDTTPQNTSIAGNWAIRCQPVNEDCPNFGIGFDSEGDIVSYDLDGNRGPQRGRGTLEDATLAFKVGQGTTYQFSGTLDGAGRNATGTITNFDYDGQQKTTAAIATRQ